MGLLGDVFNMFGGSGDEDKARALWDQLQAEAGPSAMAGVTEDPTLRNDQMSSLSALRSIASNSGLRPEDKIAYQQVTDRANQNERANRAAIFQNLAARGMTGGGQELAQQLSNQQGQATTNSMMGSEMAADANKRALQAIVQSGQMAGGIRQQDFGVKSAKAQAEDAMAQFNAGQRLRKTAGQTGQLGQLGEAGRQRNQNLGDNIGKAIPLIGSIL